MQESSLHRNPPGDIYMEDAKKQSHEMVEEKVIPMLEEKQRDGLETTAEDSLIRAETSEKPKNGPRQNLNRKPRTTVPQPFSLATERRMSRERRASVGLGAATEKRVPKERCDSLEFKKSQPGLSKSVSLNHKNQSFKSARQTADLRCEKSTLAPQRTRATSQVASLRQSSVSPVSQPLPSVAEKRMLKGRSLSTDLSSVLEKRTNTQRSNSTVAKNLKPPRLPKSVSLNHKSLSSVNAGEYSNPMREKSAQAIGKLSITPQVRTIEHSEKRPAAVPTRPKSPEVEQGNNTVSKMGNKDKMESKSIAASAKKTINRLLKNTRSVLGTPKVAARSSTAVASH